MSIARSFNLMTPGIEAILLGSKTRDRDAELADEIENLISLASKVGSLPDVLIRLESLRSAVGKYWDTSFDCTLDWARGQVIGLASTPDR